jgi:hypothetical protein
MVGKQGRNKASKCRQKIVQLGKIRDVHIDKLLSPKPMVRGSFYEVYKTCSKPNCCCRHGKRHGPFPALFISIQGKRRLKMIKKQDLEAVKGKALAYRFFQRELARVRKINKEIDLLLEELKKIFLEEYR